MPESYNTRVTQSGFLSGTSRRRTNSWLESREISCIFVSACKKGIQKRLLKQVLRLSYEHMTSIVRFVEKLCVLCVGKLCENWASCLPTYDVVVLLRYDFISCYPWQSYESLLTILRCIKILDYFILCFQNRIK